MLLAPADKSPAATSIETCGNRAILQARLALFFLLLHQIVAFDDELVLARRLKLRNKMLAFAGTAIARCGAYRHRLPQGRDLRVTGRERGGEMLSASFFTEDDEQAPRPSGFIRSRRGPRSGRQRFERRQYRMRRSEIMLVHDLARAARVMCCEGGHQTLMFRHRFNPSSLRREGGVAGAAGARHQRRVNRPQDRVV